MPASSTTVGAGRQREAPQHLLQGLGRAEVALNDLAAVGKPATVEHQGQAHPWAVGALLLGMAELRLRIGARGTLEQGVGQLVEGDGLGQREPVLLLVVAVGLQRGAQSWSLTRYRRLTSRLAKSSPSSSPRPLRGCPHGWVASSLPGQTLRPTISPRAAANGWRLNPRAARLSSRPNGSIAANPTCSAPTR